VNTWRALIGIVALRGMIFSTMPPIVSSPRLSGTTSSSVTPGRGVPDRMSAWIAAPRATTSSGSMSVSGGRPNSFSANARTAGIRVEPPTITTPSSSFGRTPASFSACRHAFAVRCRIGAAIASSFARDTSSAPGRAQESSSTSSPRRSASP
jgi:hypothetical protein